jgi:hypothetical protein
MLAKIPMVTMGIIAMIRYRTMGIIPMVEQLQQQNTIDTVGPTTPGPHI